MAKRRMISAELMRSDAFLELPPESQLLYVHLLVEADDDGFIRGKKYVLAMLGLGCGVIISSCTTKYRDLRFLVGFGVSLWMYGTPVAYSMSLFRGSILYRIVRFNPVTPVIEMLRYGFLGPEAGSLDWVSYGASWGFTVALLAGGVLMFNKVERTFMDTI